MVSSKVIRLLVRPLTIRGGVEAPTYTNNSIIHIPSALRPFWDRGIFVVSTADLKQLKHKSHEKSNHLRSAGTDGVRDSHSRNAVPESELRRSWSRWPRWKFCRGRRLLIFKHYETLKTPCLIGNHPAGLLSMSARRNST